MKQNPTALAELVFDDNWNLSPAGTASPLRYWAHVHFKDAPNRGKELWTLFVDLNEAPTEGKKTYIAEVSFMAPPAPHHYLKPNAEFNLFVGDILKARGIIKSLTAQD